MTELQMRELVSATFASAWRAARPDVGFALENEAGALPAAGAAHFAHLTIMLTTAGQMTQGAAGTRRVRRDGWLQVKLWSPADTGVRGAAGLADAARTVIEMVEMASPVAGDEPVTTQAASAQPGGNDGRWHMTLVRAPFWYVETK